MRTLILSAVVVVVASGCVTQKTFDALKAERDTLDNELSQRNQAVADLEKKKADLEQDKQALQAALEAEQDKVKDLNGRIDKLLADMAAATKDRSRLQASVQEMTTALAELEKRRAEAEARVQEFKKLLDRFKKLIESGKLKVKIVEGRMVVELATDILFASGSANLSKDGKAAIAEVAGLLASIPGREFQVAGHTDNVPIATAQYPSNWELAGARAITVVRTMVQAGMPAERISAASYADTKPVAANDSNETRAQNRRIEIVVVPDLSTLPGSEELKKIDSAR
ncbi:MAG: OmpA family protein [Myxococcota bacterium]|jgi:chemotaxis protein MotB